jgi:hypothetical protein
MHTLEACTIRLVVGFIFLEEVHVGFDTQDNAGRDRDQSALDPVRMGRVDQFEDLASIPRRQRGRGRFP